MNADPDPPDLHLVDGRRITIDSIHIAESTAGIVYVPSPERAWHMVADTETTGMPGSWGALPTFVVPPVSVQRDARILPRWKVYTRLISESLEPLAGPFGGGSHLILVFFCNDITNSPITEVIGWQLASLDEAAWRRYAQDWEP
jgi:hypothetical protein